MVQLRTQRTALLLYGVLLVLPTIVFGSLQWRQLGFDYEANLRAVPDKAEDAAARLRRSISERLARLIESEHVRPFTDYGDKKIVSDASYAEFTPFTSPLVGELRPEQILAWFAFDMIYREPAIDLWGGSESSESQLVANYRPALVELLQSYREEEAGVQSIFSRWKTPELTDVPMYHVAFNRLHKHDPDCMQYQSEFLSRLMVTLHVTPFHLQFFVDSDGIPRLVATRRVIMMQMQELDRYSTCYAGLAQGMQLVQGFLIDPDWFFKRQPEQSARLALDASQRYVAWGDPPCCGDRQEFHADIHLLADLTIETHTEPEQDFARMRIAVDTEVIDANYKSLRLRFLGLAAMLAVSLGTGMWLLLRSVRKDLEQATRTENFIAAVTHELRTPLTSIKMYGEMLLDGEEPQTEKQREYYKRIVRATERLGTLVERVLEKSRLSAGGARAEPGDLNDLVGGLERQLAQYGPEGDLRLELDPAVPDVLLTSEAVTSIVSNLVENARKYAPVDPEVPGAEPILVRTRFADGEVLLEVLDRGPGVPEAERAKIFDAFYRVGNEATRTARGAGLGLHLVLLQARAIGGDAGQRPREGGGSVFWVRFAVARSPG